MKSLRTESGTLRAAVLAVALSACATSFAAAVKNIVLVHGAFADARPIPR